MLRLLVVLFALVGCGPARLSGAPVPGEPCAGDAPECMTSSTVGTCVAGKWTEWPCVYACSNSSTPVCEKVQPSKAGDPCPPGSRDGGAVACVPVDGGFSNQVLKCIAGVAQAVDCNQCGDHGLGITCN